MNNSIDKDSEIRDILEFESILNNESVTTLYQPIIDLKTGEVIGYEATSRGPKESILYSPLDLLSLAEKLNKSWELELLFRTKAIERAKNLEKDKLLFINVDPNIMRDPNFKKGITKEYLQEMMLEPTSIVFEITERTAISDYKSFSEILNHYKEQGYFIAIDDVGAGYSGLKTINETRPRFIKIDMDLIRDIDKDSFKQAMLKAFVNLCLSTNLQVIAEGVETSEELKTLVQIGVHGGQGYYLGKPSTMFTDIKSEIREEIISINKACQHINGCCHDSTYIHNLVNQIISFEPHVDCETIKKEFEKQRCSGICITKKGYPIGLIMRYNLDSAMSKMYGYAVYSRRSIGMLMNKFPLIVDYYTPINVVANEALKRSDSEIYDDIIVVKGGKYVGMVPMKKIIHYAINYEKNYARELNPLTSLPGNVIINRVLENTIKYNNKCGIFYADLDNFKVYNDVYGFENGDSIIKMTASILNECIKTICAFNSFIGHIGGDDFVFIVDSDYDTYCILCKEIIKRFNIGVKDYFNKQDIENGYIIAEDRYGNSNKFNLTSISIAGICGNLANFNTPQELAQTLTNIKKRVKKINGSNFLIYNTSPNRWATNKENII